MSGNAIGVLFRVATWGESHGPAVGALIDGCPPRLDLPRRISSRSSTGAGRGSSHRPVPAGRRTGSRSSPASLRAKRRERPSRFSSATGMRTAPHYDGLRNLFRPGHGDITYQAKYGIRDHRGGGRASGRETAGRVAAGAVARKVIAAGGDHCFGLHPGTGRNRRRARFPRRGPDRPALLPRPGSGRENDETPGGGRGPQETRSAGSSRSSSGAARRASASPSSTKWTPIWRGRSWGSEPSRGWRSARVLRRHG